MIGNGVGKELGSKLGEFEEVELFECFGTSIQEYFDSILSNEFIFLFIVKRNLYLNYFLMKSVMVTNFESLLLGNRNKTIDYDVIYFDRFTISVLRRLLFRDWRFSKEVKGFMECRVREKHFALKVKEREQNAVILLSEKEAIVKEIDVSLEVLKLTGGSGSETQSTFFRMKSKTLV
jgi:hypothetical protein